MTEHLKIPHSPLCGLYKQPKMSDFPAAGLVFRGCCLKNESYHLAFVVLTVTGFCGLP